MRSAQWNQRYEEDREELLGFNLSVRTNYAAMRTFLGDVTDDIGLSPHAKNQHRISSLTFSSQCATFSSSKGPTTLRVYLLRYVHERG